MSNELFIVCLIGSDRDFSERVQHCIEQAPVQRVVFESIPTSQMPFVVQSATTPILALFDGRDSLNSINTSEFIDKPGIYPVLLEDDPSLTLPTFDDRLYDTWLKSQVDGSTFQRFFHQLTYRKASDKAGTSISQKSDETAVHASSSVTAYLLDRELRVLLIASLDSTQNDPTPALFTPCTLEEVFKEAETLSAIQTVVSKSLAGTNEPIEVDLQGRIGLVRSFPIPHTTHTQAAVILTIQDRKSHRQTDAWPVKVAEAAFRESEFRCRSLFESELIGLFMADADGYITEANGVFLTLIGYEKADLPLRWDELTPPEFRAADNRFTEQIRKGEHPPAYEKAFFHRDGHPIPVLLGASLVKGSIDHGFCFVIDLREQKRIEDSLLDNEERLRTVIENLSEGIVISDLSGQLVHWNRAALKLHGFEDAEDWQRPLKDFEKLFRLSTLDGLELSIEEWPLSRIMRGEVLDGCEIVVSRRDVDWHRIFSYGGTIVRSSTDIPILAFLTIVDITEKKQVDEKLRESEARFRTMADSAPVLIWMTGKDKRCHYFNRTWLEFTGRSLEEEINDGWLRAVHPEDTTTCQERYEKAFESKREFEMEYRLRRHDGVYRRILDHGSPRFTADGDFLGYIGSCTDIEDIRSAEEQLRQSQSRLAAIVQSAMDAIITIDNEQKILLFNPAAEKMFGYSANEIVGQPLNVLIPDRFRHAHHKHVESFGQTGITNRRMGALLGVSGLRKGEEEFPMEASISQIQVNGDKLFTVILRDITERELAEAELRESQERLQIALESGQTGLWDWNMIDGTVDFSAEWKRQLGYSESEIGNTLDSWQNLVHPDDLGSALNTVQEYIEVDVENYQNQFRMRHKDGTYRWILAKGRIFRDAEGRPHRMMGSHIDITSAKNAEAELRESQEALQRAHDELEQRVHDRTLELAQANRELLRNEERSLNGNRIFTELSRMRVREQAELDRALRRITEAGSEMLAVDRCSVWLFNDAHTELCCLDFYDSVSRKHSQGDCLASSDFPGYFRALETQRTIVASNAATHPATREFEETYLKPLDIRSMLDTAIITDGVTVGVFCCERTGEARDWEAEEQVFANSAAALCALALESHERARAETGLLLAKDLAESALARAEEAKREAETANRAKLEFLSRMSHELRTPLNAILGFSQLLQRKPLDAKQANRIAQISKAGQHLLALINEVLDIARIESGRLTLSIEPVSLHLIIQEALDLVDPLAGQRGIVLEKTCQSAHESHVMADRQRLLQSLLNILSNAVKYNRDGGLVELSCLPRPGGRVRLCIRDTGPGLSPEKLIHIFDPFDRLGAEQSLIEGTGLGLALTKRLIEAMGGVLGVESEVGRGTTFWIELPETQAPAAILSETGGESFKRTLELSDRPTQTILYIEDNVANLNLLEQIVEEIPGLRLLAAMQGSVGLDLARQHQPNLILLDLNLPDITGQEILGRLLADPGTSSIPVVVISADATPGTIERLIEEGARDYLTKPFDIERLLRLLNEILHEGDRNAQH